MDISYLLLLQNLREAFGSFLDAYMLEITSMAEALPTFLLFAGIYWCVDKHTGQCMAWNISLACTFSQFLKAVCKVERPWVRDERIHPVEAAVPAASGYSFPSGHTARAVATWGTAGCCAWMRGKKEKDKNYKILGAIAWVLVALILFSRNYLGVHTPQDVLFSLVFGILFFVAVERILVWVEGSFGRDIFVCAAGCFLCFLPMLRVGCMPNAGAGMGLIIGWFVERRFVKFQTEGKALLRVVRFCAGSILAVFLLEAVRPVFAFYMEGKYAGFFSMFLFTFYIMAGYPFIFSKYERHATKEGKQRYLWVAAIVCVAFLGGLFVFAGVYMRMQKSVDTGFEEPVEGIQNGVADGGEQGVQENLANEMIQGAQENLTNGTLQEVSSGQTMQIIAHRGYSSVFPENTLAAFSGALDIGVDYIEMDVQMTKDNQVVIFHDTDLMRITGWEGTIADYTYQELAAMDAGSWFSDSFAGERIPTLQEGLEALKDSEVKVYLELKDIGEVEGFEEAVLAIAEETGMAKRCIFASFRYEYLTHIKELDPDAVILYNTSSAKTSLVQEYPAEFYGVNVEAVTVEMIASIHDASGQVFVWTVDTPERMKNLRLMGADGIVTNAPGRAKVMVHPEYVFLADRFEQSITIPGLYEKEVAEKYKDMVVQGFAKTVDRMIISAYSFSGEHNSILWIADLQGNLLDIVDLGFSAHTGGIAYDELHDLLWVTGPEGKVYAISWTAIVNGTYAGEIQVCFDAGLTNHAQAKVASFLTLFQGKLYVGSYVNGANGQINCYELTDVYHPTFVQAMTIPQRIQGVTFQEDVAAGKRYMLLSQGYEMEEACLMRFDYEEAVSVYDTPLERWTLPEGPEQILMTAKGLYILFESSARFYRDLARTPNDQIYLIRI